jgi:hypothetical protein
MFCLIGEACFEWIREALGVFSAMLISYPHLYPHFAVAGTRFTGERGSMYTRGYDEDEKAGEGDEWRIKLGFQMLGPAECDSRMQNHTRRP